MTIRRLSIEHLDKTHDETVRNRERRLLAAGLCCSCGQVPATKGPRGGVKHCDTCRAKQREAERESFKRRQRKKALSEMRREERERG